MIPDAPPPPTHSLRFVLLGDYDALEQLVAEAGFTDGLFSRRDGRNYLTVDRGEHTFVSAHAVVTDCLDALRQKGVEVAAIEVYDINDTITASYHEACDVAQRWVEDEMDSLDPTSKIKLTIERYEIGLDDYLEAYSCRD